MSIEPLNYVSPETTAQKTRRWPVILTAWVSLICACLMYPWAMAVGILSWAMWIGDNEPDAIQNIVVYGLMLLPTLIGMICGVRVMMRFRSIGPSTRVVGLLGLVGIVGQLAFITYRMVTMK